MKIEEKRNPIVSAILPELAFPLVSALPWLEWEGTGKVTGLGGWGGGVLHGAPGRGPEPRSLLLLLASPALGGRLLALLSLGSFLCRAGRSEGQMTLLSVNPRRHTPKMLGQWVLG